MSTTDNQIAVTTTREIQAASIVEGALSLDNLIKQRAVIEQAMARVMKEDLHYGKIPGSKQPSLLKPGAQMLCTLFRLRPEFEIIERELPGNHKQYRVCCRLYLIGTVPPVSISEGWGEATTMESKHRFRMGDQSYEFTEDDAPGIYWKMRRDEGAKEADAWLSTAYDGRKVTVAKNPAGKFVVAFVSGDGGRVENANIADLWNTVLKMANKRAYVDACITATASNDFFTQDLEDMRENLEAVRGRDAEGNAKPGGKPPAADGKGELQTWERVSNHIGKKGGPILGKRLGDLDDGQREWLHKTLAEKAPDRRNDKDKKLFAALEMWNAERSGKAKAGKAGKPASGEEIQADGNAGVNVASLIETLEWKEIPMDVFLKVAKRSEWIKGDTIGEVTDEEAAALLENTDTLFERCNAHIKAVSGTAETPAKPREAAPATKSTPAASEEPGPFDS